MASASAGVFEAFWSQFDAPGHISRLKNRHKQLMRAVGLGASERSEIALRYIVAAFRGKHGEDLVVLANAVAVCPAAASMKQAEFALDAILDDFRSPLYAQPQLHPIYAIAALAPKLPLEQADTSLHHVCERLRAHIQNLDEVAALCRALVRLAPKVSTDQAADAFDVVLDRLRTTEDPSNVYRLSAALIALSPKARPDQVAKAFEFVRQPTFKFAFPGFVTALGSKLSPAQAPAILATTKERLLNTTDDRELAALSDELAAVASRVTLDQAAEVLAAVLERFRAAANPADHMVWVAKVVAAMGAKVGPERSSEPVSLLVSRFRILDLNRPEVGRAIAQATVILASNLTFDQTTEVFSVVLRHLTTETFNQGNYEEWTNAVTALAPKLLPEQAKQGLDYVCRRLGDRLVDYFSVTVPEFEKLARAIVMLAPKLTSEQAGEALDCVLNAYRIGGSYPHMAALADATAALGSMLDPSQAGAALDAMRRPFSYIFSTNPRSAQIIRFKYDFAIKLNAMSGYNPVTRKLLKTHEYALAYAALADAVSALAPVEANRQIDNLLSMARYRLGSAAAEPPPLLQPDAQVWANIVDRLLHSRPDPEYVANLVDVLKYPTVAGEPTDVLLSGLRKRFADAPPDGAELSDSIAVADAPPDGAELSDSIAFVKKRFPAVDVRTPPTRPGPADATPRGGS